MKILMLLILIMASAISQEIINEKRYYFPVYDFEHGSYYLPNLNETWDDTTNRGTKIINQPSTGYLASIYFLIHDKQFGTLEFPGICKIDENLELENWWQPYSKESLATNNYDKSTRSELIVFNNEIYFYQHHTSRVHFLFKYDLEGSLLEHIPISKTINNPETIGYNIRENVFVDKNRVILQSAQLTPDSVYYALNNFDLELNHIQSIRFDTLPRLEQPLNYTKILLSNNQYYFTLFSISTKEEVFSIAYILDENLNVVIKKKYNDNQEVGSPSDILQVNDKLYQLVNIRAPQSIYPERNTRVMYVYDKEMNLIDSSRSNMEIAKAMRKRFVNKQKNFVALGMASDHTHNSLDRKARNTYDFYISEIDTLGNLLWEYKWGVDDVEEVLYDALETDRGTYICTGSSRGLFYVCEIAPPHTNIKREIEENESDLVVVSTNNVTKLKTSNKVNNVQLYDFSGKKCGDYNTQLISSEIVISHDMFPSGTYIVVATTAKGQFSEKFIIAK